MSSGSSRSVRSTTMPTMQHGRRASNTFAPPLAIRTGTGPRPMGCRSRRIFLTFADMRPTSRRGEASHSPSSIRPTAPLSSAASTYIQRPLPPMTSLLNHGCEPIGQTSMAHSPTLSASGSPSSGRGIVWTHAVADRAACQKPNAAVPPPNAVSQGVCRSGVDPTRCLANQKWVVTGATLRLACS
jgi:hypothetical protein